jgi:endoglucanase
MLAVPLIWALRQISLLLTRGERNVVSGKAILRHSLAMPVFGLTFTAVAAFWGTNAALAQPAFPVHTSSQYIVDSDGNRVRLNAVNWYGAESTDFVVGGLQIASLQSIVQQISGLGFNAVRIPWSNQLYESNPVVGSYALTANPAMKGENALTILDQVIGALSNAGIMVILDNHNSDAEWCCSNDDGNTLWYNSQYPETNWIADWQGIVTRYQNNPWVIGADLRNEPRGDATWGGDSSTDWHAAAERGGNAVQNIDPNALIIVEGIAGGRDLSRVSNLPVQLNVANQLIYSAHDYGFDYSGLSGYSDYLSTITPLWGYLVTGNNPQPMWIGEFGTCNTSSTCVISSNSGDLGYWFNFYTTFVQQYTLDWSYWAINGTESTAQAGAGRTFGATETYGVLNTSWNGNALTALTAQLGGLINASPGFTLVSGGSILVFTAGQSGSSTIGIIPQNGFTGTVNLSCTVSGGPSGAVDLPACTVPSAENITGTSAVNAAVWVATTGSGSSSFLRPGCQVNLLSNIVGVSLACVLVIGIPPRPRKMLLPVVLGMAVAFSLSGCGGSSGRSRVGSTSSGTYTVTVTGTAPGTGSVATQISVNVQ